MNPHPSPSSHTFGFYGFPLPPLAQLSANVILECPDIETSGSRLYINLNNLHRLFIRIT